MDNRGNIPSWSKNAPCYEKFGKGTRAVMSGQASIPSVEDEPTTIEYSAPFLGRSGYQGETSGYGKNTQSKIKPGTPEIIYCSVLVPNAARCPHLAECTRLLWIQPPQAFRCLSKNYTRISKIMSTQVRIAAHLRSVNRGLCL